MEENKGIRLNKYISDAGHCSRREADRWIEEGRVYIDGRKGSLGDRVLPGMKVTIQGERVKAQSKNVYIVLNKPVGIVCTTDKREPMNVVDFVDHDRRIYPIGRLDKDSEGLLLMTSDGDIVNRILRAAGKHEKEYQVTVDKPITTEFLQKMASGVKILGTTTLPCQIKKTGEKAFTIILTQGLNRQIRRMCETLGYRVKTLKRVRIMNIHLGNLKLGQWRNLTPFEMKELMRRLDSREEE
ncbi:MAG: 23S rRNA pseudouridine(2604) synthase RluF [Clostridia bacterium]|nr:23S rRNA pseudouridine(2604) synthase RluF [Clostridia bacterium]MBQ4618740.1 23S rRNA pseudouridine(2604) synthase RluF [Clostridia bacterium]MBQ9855544.1 23S rRNA pseudouridine(2604) synthase RluF [Clostridia bacterium]